MECSIIRGVLEAFRCEGASPCPPCHHTSSSPSGSSSRPAAEGRDHPLGCHRPRISDRVVFDKLVQILVFGCAYWRIADEECSATTLRRRRDEWIEAGAWTRSRWCSQPTIGYRPGAVDVAVDCCITKAPCGGERAGRSPVDRGKRGIKRSMAVDADGIPLGTVAAPANRHDSPLLARPWTLWRELGVLPER